ncbi:MAG TPA: 30S ribosomal protein S14 [Gemmatimonadaceae bacterium]|uniref:Small ribosomal subunit protein uS14 n=2 Tax=environmental samples TaxID=142185 RepID=A0A0H4TEL1_9BACT|nr:30S ribosomal protein S14, small subunit ribosomal protein S14 [uncultured Gemmatimonadetes bacterium Rifle_16ft_4_minimus_37772]AKQ05390.1 30S ribosomal protein S14, small subunit ribosomal protein S14 [uncultured Gemmatimonadetes bacterium Rifle_16ft_4_minimus_27071]HLA90120.1 30S ribosomal protein S14 [Gemmatimonadaceae bacterium]
MAKKSSIEKNDRRRRMTQQYAVKRKALKAVVRDPKATDAARRTAQLALAALPRNSAPERIRNRCSMTGRSRGYVKMFGLSRIAFREMALAGLIPGVRKASW